MLPASRLTFQAAAEGNMNRASTYGANKLFLDGFTALKISRPEYNQYQLTKKDEHEADEAFRMLKEEQPNSPGITSFVGPTSRFTNEWPPQPTTGCKRRVSDAVDEGREAIVSTEKYSVNLQVAFKHIASGADLASGCLVPAAHARSVSELLKTVSFVHKDHLRAQAIDLNQIKRIDVSYIGGDGIAKNLTVPKKREHAQNQSLAWDELLAGCDCVGESEVRRKEVALKRLEKRKKLRVVLKDGGPEIQDSSHEDRTRIKVHVYGKVIICL